MKSIDDYSLITYLLKRFYTKNISVHPNSENLALILAQHPKLICAINHGTSAAPAPAFMGIFDNYLKNGGDRRKPLIIAWRGFYKVPVIKQLIAYFTQASHGMTASEFLEKMKGQGFTDLFVMPEGENCLFGDGDQIVPFLSPKFIELSVLLNIPILVTAHNGTEELCTPVSFSAAQLNRMKWLPRRYLRVLESTQTFGIPHFTKHDIEKVGLYFRLYQPTLKAEDLSETEVDRREQLQKEADKVRAMMISMKQELDVNSIESSSVERKTDISYISNKKKGRDILKKGYLKKPAKNRQISK